MGSSFSYAVLPYWDPYYDPLWRALSETETVVSCHRNHGGRPPDLKGDEAPLMEPVGAERWMLVPGLNLAGMVITLLLPVADSVDQYDPQQGVRAVPTSQVCMGEVNADRMPFWLENMDWNFHRQGHWTGVQSTGRPATTWARTYS